MTNFLFFNASIPLRDAVAPSIVVIHGTPLDTASDRIDTSSFLGFAPLGVLITRTNLDDWMRSVAFGEPSLIFFKDFTWIPAFDKIFAVPCVATSLNFILKSFLAMGTMVSLSASFTLIKIVPSSGNAEPAAIWDLA